MREKVPLLKCDDLRSGPGAIQRQLLRPERGTRMLLPNGNLRIRSTNTGSGDGVLPGRQHLLRRAKAPERAVQRADLEKEDRTRHCLKEFAQLAVVLSLPLQDPRITI
jgi:hypothetical protein